MIFPFLNGAGTTQAESSTAPAPKEYAWDFSTNTFIMENGRFKVVEGLEAIKIWVYKALSTVRRRYMAYSWNYGHELESLIGNRNISNKALDSELRRYLDEALSVNPYVKGIKDISATYDDDKFTVFFVVLTDYGDLPINL